MELPDHDPVSGALLLERLDERRPLSREADVRAAVTVLGEVPARLVIVPAVMQMLGRRAWWLPGWLDRKLPEVSIERPEQT